MDGNYSLSDLKAVTDSNNGGFGGMGGMGFIFLIVLFLFSGGGFGGFGAKSAGAVEQEILSNQHFNALESRVDDIGKGICDSTYALNNSITNEARTMQAQLANCCCENRLGQKDIQAAIHAEGEATRKMMLEKENQYIRDQWRQAQLEVSQCNQNAYIINQVKPCPIPAYNVCNPNMPYPWHDGGCGGSYC